MKKIVKLAITILSILVFIMTFNFLLEWYQRHKSQLSKREMESLVLLCPLPEKQGINICCYEDDEPILCNERETFKCGERIEVRIRLNNVDTPFYVCINQTFHPPFPIEPTDWTILYSDAIFTCSEDPTPDPDVLTPVTRLPADFLLSGRVYNTTGLRKLVEVRIFPLKNYTTISSLLKDLNSSKVILEVEKMIVC